MAGHRSSGFAHDSKRARLKPRPRLELGFGLGVVAAPSPPSFCQFPPSSQPRKLYCPDGFSTLSVTVCVSVPCALCVSGSLCRLSCVFVRILDMLSNVSERSQMGLKSFYLGVKTAIFFFAGLRPAPRWGVGAGPQTPELGLSAPKPQVRLSAEVTAARPTSKKRTI